MKCHRQRLLQVHVSNCGEIYNTGMPCSKYGEMREGHTTFLLENLKVTGNSADLELLRRTVLAPLVEKQREKESERACVWTEMNWFR